MKPFCETIVIHVLPTVRSLLAKDLHEKGLKNKEIAELMGLTPAAVTQYLKKARGSKVGILNKNKIVKGKVQELAEKMADKGLSHEEEVNCFCDICKEVRRQKILCKLHTGPKNCVVCLPTSC